MPEIPECLNRRYKALDSIIENLSNTDYSNQFEVSNNYSNVGIKLMCDFWNILKDDPDCNLTKEVKLRMGIEPERKYHDMHGSQRFITCIAEQQPSGRKCCDSDPKSGGMTPKSSGDVPLSKVLCNLNQAASFDHKCHLKVQELMATQAKLKDQIQALENREKQGIELLKEADSMWECMENCYKNKVKERMENQNKLISQLTDAEKCATKWRKNKQELQFQVNNVDKLSREIIEDTNQKTNDIKVVDVDISDLKQRIEANATDLVNIRKSISSKNEASVVRMSKLSEQIANMEKKTQEQLKHKSNKEDEGAQYVKEARNDLQQIYKVLLKKRLENEDLLAEKTALIEEIELLKKTADECREKCKAKENGLKEEAKKLSTEIAEFKLKCIKCHVCTDTSDTRRLCMECPRCLIHRECLTEGDYCTADPNEDCVCMSVKQKFLDNVFENMYTVLERQAETTPGKAVANAVLDCLKRSRNGKLSKDARKILQDFILTAVKKNLNLTIVGGAVKTRCEMDSDTYKQLMLCLTKIEPTKPKSKDKGTDVKKEPCGHWGGSSECNCPKGPKCCICSKKALSALGDLTSCPKKEDDVAQGKICPEKGPKVCPNCGMQGQPDVNSVIQDIAKYRPAPCSSGCCSFSQNMRAAQCVLDADALEPSTRLSASTIESSLSKTAVCTCDTDSKAPCHIPLDCRYEHRQQFINEVIGEFQSP